MLARSKIINIYINFIKILIISLTNAIFTKKYISLKQLIVKNIYILKKKNFI